MNFENVLVTGGAGFLGSQLVEKLIPLSKHIYIIDDLSTGNKNAIPKADNVTFFRDTITNQALLEEILPNIQHVYHLACRNIVMSVDDLYDDFRINLFGGFLLLEKAKTYCTNLQRFVYTSTASVYGNAPIIPTLESYYQINLPYAASKFSMEHYCHVYHSLYRLPTTILRLSNVYGPGQLATNPYCGVIAKFFDALEDGLPLTIFGDGTQTRDFTYVEDVMNALLLAGHESSMIGNVYNVGTGKETSVNDLAQILVELTGNFQHPILKKSKRVVDKVYRRAVDPSALLQTTKWSIDYPIKKGLQETYRWLKKGGRK